VALNGCCSSSCKDILILDDEEQKKLRKGQDKGRNVFNKAKSRMESLHHKLES
jgi:UPF0176 protein